MFIRETRVRGGARKASTSNFELETIVSQWAEKVKMFLHVTVEIVTLNQDAICKKGRLQGRLFLRKNDL